MFSDQSFASVTLVAHSGLAEPAVQADPACVVTDSGDPADEINAISDQMPGSGSNGMVKPTGAQMIAWEAMLKDIVSGDMVAACNVIENSGFPYDVVRYTDTGNNHESYLMLKENAPISLGWGTYVIKPDRLFRDVVIEIPHPRYELQTDEEGVEIFRQINAWALLVAGTHRCANSTYSPCDGATAVCGVWEPYRESDVVHVTQAIFQVSHRVLVGCGSNTVALQIHGHGRSNCPDLFISNTTCAPGELTNQLCLNAVIECNGTFSVDIADCAESDVLSLEAPMCRDAIPMGVPHRIMTRAKQGHPAPQVQSSLSILSSPGVCARTMIA